MAWNRPPGEDQDDPGAKCISKAGRHSRSVLLQCNIYLYTPSVVEPRKFHVYLSVSNRAPIAVQYKS